MAVDIRSPWLLLEHDSRDVFQHELCGGIVTGYSKTSPDKTSRNEDGLGVYCVADDVAVLCIADGVGGSNSGGTAAKIVIESLAETLDADHVADRSLRAVILDAIEQANAKVFDLGIGAATTVAVVEFSAGNIRTYHAGDSTVMLCSNRGRIKHSTIAHSPVAMAVESGLINEREAIHHKERNLISNYVGSKSMRIEIGPTLKMGKRDTLTIASDGLFDNLFPDEISAIIRAGNLPEKTRELVELAESRMASPISNQPSKPDDLSVICFRQTG